MIRRSTLLALALLALIGPFAGCNNDDDEGQNLPTTTTYEGTLTGPGGESGTLTVLVLVAPPYSSVALARDTVTATGTVTLQGGGTIDLVGTYDDVTGQLVITGGGYTFTGTAANGQIVGFYTGPNGTGSFVALIATGARVTVYCGAFDGDATGSWNLAVSNGGAALGSFTAADGVSGSLVGTVSSEGVIALQVPETLITANGTLLGGSVSGNWSDDENGDSGSWQGSTAQCD